MPESTRVVLTYLYFQNLISTAIFAAFLRPNVSRRPFWQFKVLNLFFFFCSLVTEIFALLLSPFHYCYEIFIIQSIPSWSWFLLVKLSLTPRRCVAESLVGCTMRLLVRQSRGCALDSLQSPLLYCFFRYFSSTFLPIFWCQKSCFFQLDSNFLSKCGFSAQPKRLVVFVKFVKLHELFRKEINYNKLS